MPFIDDVMVIAVRADCCQTMNPMSSVSNRKRLSDENHVLQSCRKRLSHGGDVGRNCCPAGFDFSGHT